LSIVYPRLPRWRTTNNLLRLTFGLEKGYLEPFMVVFIEMINDTCSHESIHIITQKGSCLSSLNHSNFPCSCPYLVSFMAHTLKTILRKKIISRHPLEMIYNTPLPHPEGVSKGVHLKHCDTKNLLQVRMGTQTRSKAKHSH